MQEELPGHTLSEAIAKFASLRNLSSEKLENSRTYHNVRSHLDAILSSRKIRINSNRENIAIEPKISVSQMSQSKPDLTANIKKRTASLNSSKIRDICSIQNNQLVPPPQEENVITQNIPHKIKNERRQSTASIINPKENKENSYSSKFNQRRKNLNQSFDVQPKPVSKAKTNLRYL